MTGRPRVVVAKLGLDGHDVGINLIAKSLVEAGFEVIYLGKRVPTEAVVRAAITEDADAIGVSCLSGGLAYFATRTVEGLRAPRIERASRRRREWRRRFAGSKRRQASKRR